MAPDRASRDGNAASRRDSVSAVRVHYDDTDAESGSTPFPTTDFSAQALHHHLFPSDTSSSRRRKSRSDTDVPPRHGPSLAASSPPPLDANLLRRRSTRAATLRTLDDCDDFLEDRPGWQPGSEPGYDPKLPDGGHASVPTLSAPCTITVVDFSLDGVVSRNFDNDGLISFIQRPMEAWTRCRWININGLSWDVIQAVGARKGLHKLALEDIMNVRNRTKADWYPNHAFIVMTLQKLVHMDAHDGSDSDSDCDSLGSASTASRSKPTLLRKCAAPVRSLWRRWRRPQPPPPPPLPQVREKHLGSAAAAAAATRPSPLFAAATHQPQSFQHQQSQLQQTTMLRSLQRFHASGNEARTDFMEKHSSLAPYDMAVSAEQVSIFLTNDNTVISFFEASAADVERPIIKRLSTPGTILRESCDASLLVQAIIDAIIDLALPLTAVYTDLLGDIELDVLTAPSIKQSRSLYICISEINKMLRFLTPIDNLVNVMRDHRAIMTQEQAQRVLADPSAGVIVTPLTHTYLGDVLDHCIIITEAMQQLKQSSEDLINLIFNTITANQNESMKQLTTVTIIFLPLTFITGFFGQNFAEEAFPELHNGIWYFWACAVPTAVATILILMRDMIYAWFVRAIQRKKIINSRKKARSRRRRKRKPAVL